MTDTKSPIANRMFGIGIDFGTTKSALAFTRLKDIRPDPVIGTSQLGIDFCPTAIYITPEGNKLIGEQAEGKWRSLANKAGVDAKENNENFLRDFKLKIVDNEYRTFLHRRFSLDGTYELAALVIYYLKAAAENYELKQGGAIVEAVITFPASWGNEQKENLIKAANIAGIENPILLKEPIAALYEINRWRPLSSEKANHIVVIDYGGGTCDVTVCKTSTGSFLISREPEILAEQTENLGGKDIDQAIVQYLITKFREQHPGLPENCLRDFQITLLQEAKRHKEKFSDEIRLYWHQKQFLSSTESVPEYNFEIPHLYDNRTLAISWDEKTFGKIIFPKVKEIINPVMKAIRKAGLERKDIQLIALVGGSSFLPTVQDRVKEMISPYNVEVFTPPRPRHAVVFGAGIFHYYERNPTERSDLEGRKRYATLRIGLDTNLTYELVKANESLPVKRRVWECKTSQDNMRFIDILILEGDNEQIKDNETYAWKRFNFNKPVPKGTRIIIEYEIDQQDIFAMYAYLKDNPEINESIIGRQSISPEEIRLSRTRLSMPVISKGEKR